MSDPTSPNSWGGNNVVSIPNFGLLQVVRVNAATGADTDETLLWTYPMPPGLFDVVGTTVRITALCQGDGTETLNIVLNGNPISILGGAPLSSVVVITAWLIQRGTDLQTLFYRLEDMSGIIGLDVLNITYDESLPIIIGISAQNDAPVANGFRIDTVMTELLQLTTAPA